MNLDYNFGSIQKLEESTRALIVVCQYKTQPIYVNRDRLLDFNSNQSIGRTNRILNIAESLINNWGTRNPESVLNMNGRIYAFDSLNGIVWRFAQDGQTNMSIGNTIRFRQLGTERLSIDRNTDKIVSGWDDMYNAFNRTILELKRVTYIFTK